MSTYLGGLGFGLLSTCGINSWIYVGKTNKKQLSQANDWMIRVNIKQNVNCSQQGNLNSSVIFPI